LRKHGLSFGTIKEKRVNDFPGMFEKDDGILKRVQKEYMKELFLDTLGFAGVEIIRRIFGIAHVADLESIQDLRLRYESEILSLRIAKELIIKANNFNSVDDVIQLVKAKNN